MSLVPASVVSAAAPFFEEATRSRFTFRDLPPLWVVALLIVPAVIGFVVIAYGLERGTPRRERLILGVLRALAIAAVAAIFFRPALETIRYRMQKTIVPVLIDDSASMRRSDAYAQEAERKALAKAAELPDGDSPTAHTRAELAARTVKAKLLPRLKDRFDVRLYRFSDELSPITSPDDVSGSGSRTRIGEALARIVEECRGRSVPGVVLISDGRSNDGRDPREAARLAAAELVPIHTVGVGDPSAPSNLAVEIVEAPEVALENDEVVFSVRVSATGVEDATVPVILVAEDEEGAETETLAESTAQVSGGATPTRVTLKFTPRAVGEMRVAVKVPPRPDEALTDDNVARRTIRVKPEKIRVLYVEGYPRWEYLQLMWMLKRADRNVVVHCFLTSADRDFPQETTRGETPLKEIPNDRRTLLEQYDVVILGDVSPEKLGRSREDRERFMESVRDFVRRGGGFLMIAGEYDSPRSYAGTPIQELLPVELGGAEEDALVGTDRSVEFRPRFDNPYYPHEIVRFDENIEKNRQLLEEPNSLSGHYWFSPVRKAKAGAEVLLRHPDAKNRYGNLVLAAVTFVPEGRSMFMGIDSTWRWRYVYGETYFNKFWRRAIRYLALNRLKSGDRRYRLSVERSVFELNDRAVLEARVLDDAFQPSGKPKQPAFVKSARTGKVATVTLDPVSGETGIFRAAFPVGEEGRYEAWLTDDDAPGGKQVAAAEFEARLPDRENREPMLDAATLQAVASVTGATYVPLSRLEEVARRFSGGGPIEIPESTEVKDLWDTPTTLLILVAVLAAEWWLRKRAQLV